MTLLLWLTLAYAAVLVPVLAIGLLLVWLRLRAIDRGLDAARHALIRVRDASADLDTRIDPLRDRLLAAVTVLEEAADDLSEADERLGERVGVTAAGRPA